MPYSIVFPCPAGGCLLAHFVTCTHSLPPVHSRRGRKPEPHPPPVGCTDTHPSCLRGPHSSFRPGPNAAATYAHCLCPPLFLALARKTSTAPSKLAPANPLWSQEAKVQALVSPSLGALGQGVGTLAPPYRVCPLAA